MTNYFIWRAFVSDTYRASAGNMVAVVVLEVETRFGVESTLLWQTGWFALEGDVT